MSTYGYRRGSIFWALSLIAVGGLFLYQNFNPAVRPWQIIAKFWPILIIFWGLSKLIDHLRAHAHPETIPPPLFSGSEVVLLLLILALGTLVSKIVLRPWHQWPSAIGINDEDFESLFSSSYNFTKTLSQSAKPQPHLVLVNRRGDVDVRATDAPQFDAAIKETIRADSEDAARKLSDQLKLELVDLGGRYELRSNFDSLPNQGRSIRLDITLHVPSATSTDFTAEHGDITVDGLKGDQKLAASHGDVRASNMEGLLRVRKSGGGTEIRDVKGNVEVEGRGGDVEISKVTGTVTVSGEFSGGVEFRDITQTLRFTSSRTDLTLQKLSGHLNLETGSLEASGVDGPVELSTREKDISVEGFKHSLKITNTNGDINLRAATPPTQPIEVDSKKGEIVLALPANSSFQIDATSRHGEVQSDFSGSALKLNTEGDAPSITGSYGKGGGPTIHLSTAYGTIRLERQGVHPPTAPAPPAAPARPTSSDEGDETRVGLPQTGQAPEFEACTHSNCFHDCPSDLLL